MSKSVEYPCECHFRIIAENLENMHFVIETVIMELGINTQLIRSNVSGKGNYISFGFSTVVYSKEKLDRIDAELRNIVGVKFVM